MFINYFLSIVSIAGVAVLWRNLLRDLPHLKKFVRSLPNLLSRALLCGFCFTYWFSFLFLFIFNPLTGWEAPFRDFLPIYFYPALTFLFSWLAISFGAVFLRFLYAFLQERLNQILGHTPHH